MTSPPVANQAGRIGLGCDTEINECASSPCVHGECADAQAAYTCR